MGSSNFPISIGANVTGAADAEKLANAMNNIANSLDKASGKAKESQSSFDSFAETVRGAIQNPLNAAGSAVEGFLTKLGPVGTGLSVAASGLAALGTAAVAAMNHLGNLADNTGDTAIRLGLTTKEVGQFAFAMQRAGGDISSLEMAMRTLSRGLSSSDEEGKKARQTLQDMGIKAGPVKDVLLAVSDAFANMTNTADRNTAALNLFGRAGLDLLPDLMELSEGIQRAKELGLGVDEKTVKEWDSYRKQLVDVSAIWAQMRKTLEEPLAAGASSFLSWIQNPGGVSTRVPMVQEGKPYYLNERGQMVVFPGGGTSASTNEQNPWDQKSAPFSWQGASFRLGSAPDSLIDTRQASWNQTRAGLESLLRDATKTESDAREAFFGARGSGKSAEEIDKLQAAWDQAAQKAAEYKTQIEAIDKASEAAEKRAKDYQKASEQTAQLLGWRGMMGSAARSGQWTPEIVKPISDIGSGDQTLKYNSDQYLKSLQEQAQFLQESITQDEQTIKQSDALHEQAQKAELEHRVRMIELLSGPGGEIAAIQQIYELRVASAQTTQEAQEAEYQRTEQLLQLHKQQVESYVSLVQGGLNALLSGGNGMSSFLKSQGTGLLSTIAGNFTRMEYSSIQKYLPNAKEGTFLGGLMAGTPFGADPLKAATDLNTQATIANTAALRSMSAGGSSGGFSSVARAASAIGGGSTSYYDPYMDDGSGSSDTFYYDPYMDNDPFGAYSGGGPSRMPGWMKTAGTAAAIAGGGYGIYSGISSGGVRGGLTAGASALGVMGAVLPMISKSLSFLGPIGMLGGIGLGLITSLFGNGKQDRLNEENNWLSAHKYSGPDPISITTDMYGRGINYDMRGNLRTSGTVVNNYYQNTVHAMDAPSLTAFLERNPEALNRGMAKAIDAGGDFVPRTSQALGLS